MSPGREIVKLSEGSEPEEFWAALGGKSEYASSKWLAQELPNYPPRLFQCSNASGRFNVEEIFDFAQDVRMNMQLHVRAVIILSLLGSH